MIKAPGWPGAFFQWLPAAAAGSFLPGAKPDPELHNGQPIRRADRKILLDDQQEKAESRSSGLLPGQWILRMDMKGWPFGMAGNFIQLFPLKFQYPAAASFRIDILRCFE